MILKVITYYIQRLFAVFGIDFTLYLQLTLEQQDS